MNIILASGSPRRKELLEQIGLKFEVIPAKGEEIITKTIPSEIVCELSLQKAEEVAAMTAAEPDMSDQSAVKKEAFVAEDGGQDTAKNNTEDGRRNTAENNTENGKQDTAGGREAGRQNTAGNNTENGKQDTAGGREAGRQNMAGNNTENKKQDVAESSGQNVTGFSGREVQIIIGADTVVCLDGKVMGKPADRESAIRMLESLQGRKHSVYTGVAVLVRRAGQELARHTFFSETKVQIYPMERRDIEEYVDTGDPMDKAGAYGIQGRFAAWVKSIEGDYNNVVGLPVSALWQVLKNYR